MEKETSQQKVDRDYVFDNITCANFVDTRRNIENLLSAIDHDPAKSILCGIMARHYRHLAQIDAIALKAIEEAKYFSEKGQKYLSGSKD
jgi:hypothetical protein